MSSAFLLFLIECNRLGFAQTPGQERAGIEIEMTRAVIRPFFQMVDWDLLEQQYGDTARRLLRDERTMPIVAWDQLNELGRSELIRRGFRSPPTAPDSSSVFRRNESNINSENSLIPVQSGIQTSGEHRIEGDHRQVISDRPIPSGYSQDVSGLVLPEGSREAYDYSREMDRYRLELAEWEDDFRIIWDRLPMADRLFWVPIRYWPTEYQFHIAKEGLARNLVLRRDLPVETLSFMNRFEWIRDNDSIEFRHREPRHSVNEALQDAEHLSRLMGIHPSLFRDSGDVNGFLVRMVQARMYSFHLHWTPGHRNLGQEVSLMNLGVLLEGLSRGESGVLDHHLGFLPITEKGLVRLLDGSVRIEMRHFPYGGGPRSTLNRFSRILNEPSDSARALIDRWMSDDFSGWRRVFFSRGKTAMTPLPGLVLKSGRITYLRESLYQSLLAAERMSPGNLARYPELMSELDRASQLGDQEAEVLLVLSSRGSPSYESNLDRLLSRPNLGVSWLAPLADEPRVLMYMRQFFSGHHSRLFSNWHLFVEKLPYGLSESELMSWISMYEAYAFSRDGVIPSNGRSQVLNEILRHCSDSAGESLLRRWWDLRTPAQNGGSEFGMRDSIIFQLRRFEGRFQRFRGDHAGELTCLPDLSRVVSGIGQ